MLIDRQKNALRIVAKVQRREAKARASGKTPELLGECLVQHADKMNIGENSVLAGYWAIADEINVIPAMTKIGNKLDVQFALPVVVQNNSPLIFRSWRMGDALYQGRFGTSQPADDAKEIIPDVLLVPLLAFNLEGYRIGWGGGFYDRSLARLRASQKSVIAIGIAYAGQQIDTIALSDHDQPMDWIMTEKWMHKVDRS